MSISFILFKQLQVSTSVKIKTNWLLLKLANGYLQICFINNETISHFIEDALSDPENEYLSKACRSKSCHESMCKQCDLLFETINSILSIIATLDSIEKADVQHDATLAKNNIFKWLQHIICYAQQDKGKQDCQESLLLLPEIFANGFS